MDLLTPKLMADYEAIRNERLSISESRNERLKSIIGEEAHAKHLEALAQVDSQIALELGVSAEDFEKAEKAIKDAVIKNGATIDGVAIQVQYVKPSVSWDGKKLDGLALVIPAINDCRTEKPASTKVMPKKKA